MERKNQSCNINRIAFGLILEIIIIFLYFLPHVSIFLTQIDLEITTVLELIYYD